MQQAITVKTLAPTNTRGTRVKATAAAGSLTVAWDNAWTVEQNHAFAAEALAKRYGWRVNPIGGVIPDGRSVFLLKNP